MIEDAVMASEIEQLHDLTGYLKLASHPEWRRLCFSTTDRRIQFESWVVMSTRLCSSPGKGDDVSSPTSTVVDRRR
jgi:hypothetical protein